MSAADDVAEHIRISLLDLRRRLDGETAATVAAAVIRGAEQALRELQADDAFDAVPHSALQGRRATIDGMH